MEARGGGGGRRERGGVSAGDAAKAVVKAGVCEGECQAEYVCMYVGSDIALVAAEWFGTEAAQTQTQHSKILAADGQFPNERSNPHPCLPPVLCSSHLFWGDVTVAVHAAEHQLHLIITQGVLQQLHGTQKLLPAASSSSSRASDNIRTSVNSAGRRPVTADCSSSPPRQDEQAI